MKFRQSAAIITSTGALLASLSPMYVQAATYPMRHTKIELNNQVLASPSGFIYQNTTYMPLFYVQQLLNKLHIQNTWNGTTWTITTPFPNQPSMTLNSSSGPVRIVINQKTFDAHVNKVVTMDPSSGKNTTFIPIWYIQQTLKSLGLISNWDGTIWNVNASYTDDTKTNDLLGSFSNLPDAEDALLNYPGGIVKNTNGSTVFTEVSFENVDLRYSAPSNINATSINKYLISHSILMSNLGQAFMEAQSVYGVDANYLVSHAIEETGSDGNFSSIALQKNNLYGYGAFDIKPNGDAGTFPSEAYSILYQAWEIRNNYLNPGSSHYTTPTLSGIAQNYASDPNWANKVNNLMDQFAIDENDNVNSYTQYTVSNQPRIPSNSSTVPVYQMDGASGTIGSDAYYETNVPVYSDSGVGHQYMFARELQLGDVGDDVQTLQAALNNSENANLNADGVFGQLTEAALQQYQTSHGLPATGVCDFNLWNNVLNLSHAQSTVSAGQSTPIDGIVEGMAGGNVTEWYHIVSIGWINADDVALKNVYQITVPQLSSSPDVTVSVQNASGTQVGTLHVGDYVVSQNSMVTNGKIAVQYVDQTSNTTVVGYIDASNARLTQVAH